MYLHAYSAPRAGDANNKNVYGLLSLGNLL